jgi:RNA polymerase sigma-70 factor (ECF subfamily)
MTPVESAWSGYRNQLLAFIQSRVKSVDDAEDILHSVFEKLLKQSAEKAPPENVIAWLYRVARNSIIDYYRAEKNHEELPDDLAQQIPDGAVVRQLAGCIMPMIQALPETYRIPLLLSDIEGKNQKQVAEELGLSLAALKSRVLRGREKLYDSMRRCCALERDHTGSVVDFKQKSADICGDSEGKCE